MNSCDINQLTELEVDLVAMYRLLSEENREFIFDFIHYKYTQLIESDGISVRLINVFRHEQAAKNKNRLRLLQHSL